MLRCGSLIASTTGASSQRSEWKGPRATQAIRTHRPICPTQRLQRRLTTAQRRRIHRNPQTLLLRFKVLLMSSFSDSLAKQVHCSQESNVKNNSPQSSSVVLQHQSKSFPPRHLQRTSSISSESSVENLHQVRWWCTKKKENELFTNCNHIWLSFCFLLAQQQRGSSPQIRFTGLSAGDGHDGRFLVSWIRFKRNEFVSLKCVYY